MNMKLVMFPILVCLFLSATSAQTGDLELIDYQTQIATDESQFFENKHIVLVFLKENSVGEEEQILSEFNELKKIIDELNASTSQQQISLYSIRSQQFAKKFGILQYPHVNYHRNGNYVKFKGPINAASIFNWIEETVDKKTKRLDDSSFEHDTQAATGATTGDWLVMFHTKDCKTKTLIEPNWEMASISDSKILKQRLENQVNFAYVDLTTSPALQERFHIYNSPTVIFFKRGLMYRYELGNFEVESLVSFTTNGFYKNVKAERVPRELTWFDRYTDEIVTYLKTMEQSHVYGIFVFAGALCLLIWIWIYKKFERKSGAEEEDFKLD